MDILGTAYYYRGLAALDLNQLDEVEDNIQKGIKVYDQLLTALKESWQNASTKERMTYYKKEKARGLLYLQTIAGYTGKKIKESARLVRKALSTSPGFDEAIIALAIMEARKGHLESAQNFAFSMELYPDRFYNMACIHALLGNSKEAIQYLERHLKEYTPPLRIGLEKRYARYDPDLRALRNSPDFSSLME
jgi:tetratricopeptide (TPR) repeat protein